MNVLFVCIHNSARSQMAEAFANAAAAGRFRAYSAGLESGVLNPLVVTAMAESGIDISGNRTKTVRDPDILSRAYDYVITVCDQASAEACPIHPTTGARLHWSFPDPSAFRGTDAEKLACVRTVRDAIHAGVNRFVKEHV